MLYVFYKAKITKIAGLCFGLVLLGGFIPTVQALPLPESYFTPQLFSHFDSKNVGSLGSRKITASYSGNFTRFGWPRPSTLIPGHLQSSPDPAFPDRATISHNAIELGSHEHTHSTFIFDRPLTEECHIFIDDVDLRFHVKFTFFDSPGATTPINPQGFLVNPISDPRNGAGMPTVTRTDTDIEFISTGGNTFELTNEIIPVRGTVSKIVMEIWGGPSASNGTVGIYFSCSTPPLSKVFTPAVVKEDQVSALVFTIDIFGNPLHEAHFVDILPSSLKVANPSNAATTCGGGSSVTANPDSDSITFTHLTHPYDNTVTTCTLTVDVVNKPFHTNLDCSSSPPAFTNDASSVGTLTFNTDGLHACLVVNPQHDYGDAPDSYGTTIGSPLGVGAAHIITGPRIGRAPDAEADGLPGVTATGDDLDNLPDEGGVTFESFADGTGKFRIDAHVTGVNATGENAMLCGYLDGAGNGTVDGSFSRNIDYDTSVGTIFGAKARLDNEEVCIQVFYKTTAPANIINVTPDPAHPGFHGASAKCDSPQSGGTFSCTFTFNPDFTTPVTTYA